MRHTSTHPPATVGGTLRLTCATKWRSSAATCYAPLTFPKEEVLRRVPSPRCLLGRTQSTLGRSEGRGFLIDPVENTNPKPQAQENNR